MKLLIAFMLLGLGCSLSLSHSTNENTMVQGMSPKEIADYIDLYSFVLQPKTNL